MSPRARARRSDNSPRVAVRRLIAELSRSKQGPDVLCGWGPLLTVLNAATDHLRRHPAPKLLRHVRTVERWMSEAKHTEDVNTEGA
jgi:hypothetical protein